MTEPKEIATIDQPSADITVQTTEQNMIAVIAKIASDPNTDVEKIERLLDVQIKMMDRQSKIDYDHALSRAQSRMPRITKRGEIKTRDGKTVATFMRYEDIDREIRPILKDEGFSLMHDREDRDGKMIVKTTLKHSGGHQETVAIPLPYDQTNALKSALQAAVSTFSVGKRVNVCSLLNIVAEGDDDASNIPSCITIDDSQAEEIKNALRETGSDVKRFLEYMGVDCVESIPMKDFPKAYMALKRKVTGK